PTLVVTDMMNHIVTSQVFKHARTFDHVRTTEIVTHNRDAVVFACLDYAFDCFLMCPRHHHNVGGSSLCHHLRLEIAAVHCLEIGYNRNGRERFTQLSDAV